MAPSPSGTSYSCGLGAAQAQLGHVSEIDTRGPAEQHYKHDTSMEPADGPPIAHAACTSRRGEGGAGPTAPASSVWPPSSPPSSHHPHPETQSQTQTQTHAPAAPAPGAAGPPPLDEAQQFFRRELSQMEGAFPSRAEVARRQAAGASKPAFSFSSSSPYSSSVSRTGSGGDNGDYVGVPLSEGQKQAAKDEARQLAAAAGLPGPGGS